MITIFFMALVASRQLPAPEVVWRREGPCWFPCTKDPKAKGLMECQMLCAEAPP